jgi:hypothetical protein
MSHFRSRSSKVVRAQLATVLARLRLIDACTFRPPATKNPFFFKKSAFFLPLLLLNCEFLIALNLINKLKVKYLENGFNASFFDRFKAKA